MKESDKKDNEKMNNELMGSNHQTTNLVFPKFFNSFFLVWAVEKENKLFNGPRQAFSQLKKT